MSKKNNAIVANEIDQAILEAAKTCVLADMEASRVRQESEELAERQSASDKASARLESAVSNLTVLCRSKGRNTSEVLNQLNPANFQAMLGKMKGLGLTRTAQLFECSCKALIASDIVSDVELKADKARKEKLIVKDNPKAQAYAVLLKFQKLCIDEVNALKLASDWKHYA